MVNVEKRARVDDSEIRPRRKVNKIGTDHLTSLPEDCLLDVFERLNHNDLDEVATLGWHLSHLSDLSRKKARRIRAEKMTILQIDPARFHFTVNFNNRDRFLMMESNLEELSKLLSLGEMDDDDHRQQINDVKRAARLIRRFDFASCVGHKIAISNPFLDCLERIVSSHSFTSLHLANASLDANLGDDGEERFTDLLLSSAPTSLVLHFGCEQQFIDEDFLEDYAQACTFGKISVGSKYEESSQLSIEQFSSKLALLQTLEITRLVVDSSEIVKALMIRLRTEKSGRWRFRVTRDVDWNDVEAALSWNNSLASGLKYVQYSYAHCIGIKGTTISVIFNTRPYKTSWLMDANFWIGSELF